MAEGYRVRCLNTAERLGNDQLHALMAGVVRRDTDESKQLFETVTPLLIAFYEGQVQAGRIGREDAAGLVQEAFNALYLGRIRYDPNLSFRAWILDIARSTLLANLGTDAVAEPVADVASRDRHKVLRVT